MDQIQENELWDVWYSELSLTFQVARLMIQVGGESNSQGFCLALFFFYSGTPLIWSAMG